MPPARFAGVQIDGQLVVNPDLEGRGKATLNIVVAGTADAIIMVEGGAHEVSEELMLDALDLGHEAIKKIIGGINQLRELAGGPSVWWPPAGIPEAHHRRRRHEEGAPSLEAALAVTGKQRRDAIKAVSESIKAEPDRRASPAPPPRRPAQASRAALEKLSTKVMRQRVINGACASTAAPRTRSAPSGARSASPPAPTARRSSPAARPRPS
jgi:polyribonucleotide nucleotidyltransferase